MGNRIVCFLARSLFRFAGCLDWAYDRIAPSLKRFDAKLMPVGRWIWRKGHETGVRNG
jgi:hypothetical protein